jgi:protein arginine kinase
MSGLKETVGEQFGRWLAADGPDAGIVLSSRVRLARNLANMMFAHKATRSEQSTIISIVRSGVQKCDALNDLNFVNVGELDRIEKRFLMERYIISREMALGDGERALFLSADQSLNIMLNEEDHLRIQGLESGLRLRNAWQKANDVDDQLGQKLDYAFSDKWGFLTACPTNVGTGLRGSVMVHLPALIMTRKIASTVQAFANLGCAVRGLHGEGTDALGDFFQVSNHATLGQDDGELIGNVERMAGEVVAQERRARESLLEKNKRQMEDRLGRALGILKGAKILGLGETIGLLSALRLGICTGLYDGCSIPLINELMIRVQPAHLGMLVGQELEPLEVDSLRADVVQKTLS